jgi:release factor glutamine methyltransferase
MVATDISPMALRVAERNVDRHGLKERICLSQADLLRGIAGPFDLICSNPPYIPTKTLRSLPVFAHEPTLALDGGPDGLACIRKLLVQSAERLADGGLVLVEIEARQGAHAAALARECFPDAEISILKDLAGLDRVLRIEPAVRQR